MKKKSKVIIAGLAIAVIGVVVLVCALGMSGWKFDKFNNWQEDSYSTEAQVFKLALKVNAGQVTVKQSATDVISVKYEYDERYKPEITLQADNVLKIETGKKLWYQLNWWFDHAPKM